MKTINLPKVPQGMARLLQQARKSDLLVRLTDGSEFMLVAIDDFDLEVARTRANSKLMKLLDARARQTKTVSLEDVKKRFGV